MQPGGDTADEAKAKNPEIGDPLGVARARGSDGRTAQRPAPDSRTVVAINTKQLFAGRERLFVGIGLQRPVIADGRRMSHRAHPDSRAGIGRDRGASTMLVFGFSAIGSSLTICLEMSGTVLKLTVAGASKQLWFFFTRQDAASAAGAAETAQIAKQKTD